MVPIMKVWFSLGLVLFGALVESGTDNNNEGSSTDFHPVTAADSSWTSTTSKETYPAFTETRTTQPTTPLPSSTAEPCTDNPPICKCNCTKACGWDNRDLSTDQQTGCNCKEICFCDTEYNPQCHYECCDNCGDDWGGGTKPRPCTCKPSSCEYGCEDQSQLQAKDPYECQYNCENLNPSETEDPFECEYICDCDVPTTMPEPCTDDNNDTTTSPTPLPTTTTTTKSPNTTTTTTKSPSTTTTTTTTTKSPNATTTTTTKIPSTTTTTKSPITTTTTEPCRDDTTTTKRPGTTTTTATTTTQKVPTQKPPNYPTWPTWLPHVPVLPPLWT